MPASPINGSVARNRSFLAHNLRLVLSNQWKYGELNTFISKSRPSLDGLLLHFGLGKEEIPNNNLQQKLSRDARLLAIKDNIATADSRTTCGSGILQQYQSPFEASVVSRLRQFKALPIGKTNLDEFGMGSHSTNSFFGLVHHDLSKQYSVGGSSGGSAVAIATEQCQIALGTDTGGSVRLPAAYTGTVGFKPSYGLISRWGVIPYANSLDTVGILTPSVGTSLELFIKAEVYDPRDPTCIADKFRQSIGHKFYRASTLGEDLNGIRIGVPLEYNIMELDPGIRKAWQDALEMLQEKGCTIVPISLPNTKHALSAYYVLAASEAASNLSKYDGVRFGTRSTSTDGSGQVLFSDTREQGFGDEVKRRILLGSYTLSSEAIDNYFIKAQKVRRLVQCDFDRVFSLPNPLLPAQQFDLADMDESIGLKDKLGPAQVDFIVCPTAPTVAPSLESIFQQTPVDIYMNDVFTVPSSLAGIPAITVPVQVRNEYSKPDEAAFAGIQFLGQYNDDLSLLRISRVFESLQKAKYLQSPAVDASVIMKPNRVRLKWTNGVQTIRQFKSIDKEEHSRIL